MHADSHSTDPAETRPLDDAAYHTDELPPLPQRDRTIVADRWVEAPAALHELGDDIGRPRIVYKRRIGDWLLWRAGPPTRAHARYMALSIHDPSVVFVFRLFPDGTGDGIGPSGDRHNRFRAWKEDLRDRQPSADPDVLDGPDGDDPAGA